MVFRPLDPSVRERKLNVSLKKKKKNALVGASSHATEDCGFNPRSGSIWEAIDQCFSLTSIETSLSLLLSLESRKISSGEDFFKKKKKGRVISSKKGLWKYLGVNIPGKLFAYHIPNLLWTFLNVVKYTQHKIYHFRGCISVT